MKDEKWLCKWFFLLLIISGIFIKLLYVDQKIDVNFFFVGLKMKVYRKYGLQNLF